MAPGQAPTQRTALADKVLLAHELVEATRAHPGCQRLALGRWLEQGFGAGADGTSSRRHGADDGSAAATGPGVWGRADPRQPSWIPVTNVTSHRPIRNRVRPPAMMTIRRMSRAT